MTLTPAQQDALDSLRGRAAAASGAARLRIEALLRRHGMDLSERELLLQRLREGARVTLNFHPDRPTPSGELVSERLLREGRYLSQFSTGVSSGSRTAFAGGDRDLWERALFGGAYQRAADLDGEATHSERPTYGGLGTPMVPAPASARAISSSTCR